MDRTHNYKFRLSEDEKAGLMEDAADCGVNLSDYLRGLTGLELLGSAARADEKKTRARIRAHAKKRKAAK